MSQLKTIIKAGLKRLIDWVVAFMGKTSVGRYLYGQIINNAMGRTQVVAHEGVRLVFSIPNALTQYRADTFSTKEPETLEWIDGMPRGSVVWDIGANVGLYTCYSAKARGCRVFAFEPSVFNLELLARNIFLNGLTNQATIVPLPLSDKLAVSRLNMTTTEWGGALSTFGQTYGHDGQPMRKVFEFSTIGLSMVDAVDFLKIPRPDYIKIDVDGIEHLIVKGGISVMSEVKEILIEVNDDFHELAEQCQQCLSAAGLKLREKVHAPAMAENPLFRNTYNQIWHRGE